MRYANGGHLLPLTAESVAGFAVCRVWASRSAGGQPMAASLDTPNDRLVTIIVPGSMRRSFTPQAPRGCKGLASVPCVTTSWITASHSGRAAGHEGGNAFLNPRGADRLQAPAALP
jgi:hypothetical protein